MNADQVDVYNRWAKYNNSNYNDLDAAGIQAMYDGAFPGGAFPVPNGPAQIPQPPVRSVGQAPGPGTPLPTQTLAARAIAENKIRGTSFRGLPNNPAAVCLTLHFTLSSTILVTLLTLKVDRQEDTRSRLIWRGSSL